MVTHDVVVSGVNLRTPSQVMGSMRPVIVARKDDDFIGVLLDRLKTETGRIALHDSIAEKPRGHTYVRLYQPVHGHFNLVLLQINCDRFGHPRLDPHSIEGAGLVVRHWPARQAKKGTKKHAPAPKPKHEHLEGWMVGEHTFRGWVPFGETRGITHDADPDSARRRPALRAGHPYIDSFLPAPETLNESVTSLFVAPPEVCAAAKATILYGLVPVTSSETTEIPQPVKPVKDFTSHLSPYLQALDGGTPLVPRRNKYVTAEDLDQERKNAPLDDPDKTMTDYIAMLRQLAIEFDAFRHSPKPTDITPLMAELNQIGLVFRRDTDVPFLNNIFPFFDDLNLAFPNEQIRPLGIELEKQARVLVFREGGAAEMPDRWPIITPDQATRIADAARKLHDERAAAYQPGRKRFMGANSVYQLRAFVRVRHHEGCPPALHWSQYSDPFTIVPWYETSDVPPKEVPLPEITPDSLKQLKPNVAFRMDEGLFNTMNQNTPAKLLLGIGGFKPGGVTLDWLCGFNIPIITICALILLHIMLHLLDIIFRWLPYVKICIPIPKVEE